MFESILPKALPNLPQLTGNRLMRLNHMSLPALLQMGGAGAKLQHALSGCINRVAFHDLYKRSTALQRSRLISQAQRGANAWIEAVSKDRRLMMTDREFQWAMRYRVGSEMLQHEDLATACRCLVGVTTANRWGLSCLCPT